MRIPYGQPCSQYDKGIKECMYMYFIIRVKSQVTEMFFEIPFIHHLDDYFYFSLSIKPSCNKTSN